MRCARRWRAIPEAAGVAWLDGHLHASVQSLLDAPWILDTDTTIKAAVRPAGGGGGVVQPQEARAALAQLPHVPDGGPAAWCWG